MCRQNKLTDLPADLDRLEYLETLSVSSNQLTSLPSCLANMHRYDELLRKPNR